MKKILLLMLLTGVFFKAKSQVTTLPGGYKVIYMGNNGIGDFTRSLLLLHEIFNGSFIEHNFAIGTISAMRGHAGAFNRLDVVNVNTSSAYSATSAGITSYDDGGASWNLKTCTYSGKRYLALEVPYSAAFHNWGFTFTGITTSTAENMKCISYESNGVPINQNLISDIQDYGANMSEKHSIARMSISGSLGLGTDDTKGYKLAVAGSAVAESVTVKLQGAWPDYVFDKEYQLPSLSETEKSIKENGHLLGIPSAADVKTNGIDLGEMNAKLLQKIEELTLHLIEKDKQLSSQELRLNKIEAVLNKANIKEN